MSEINLYWVLIPSILLFLFLLGLINENKSQGRFGSSKFDFDFGFNRWNKGFYIDGRRLSFRESCRHMLLIGSSGEGKTQNLIAYNIFTLARSKKYSLLVADPKLELLDLTSGYCKNKLGMDVYVLNMHDPQKSIGWNPFYALQVDGIKKIVSDIYDIANTSKDSEAIWKYGSCELIEIVIHILLEHESGKYLNFTNIRHVLNNMQAFPERTSNWLRTHSPTNDLKISLERYLNSDDKIQQGWISGAIASIIPYCSQSVLKISSHHTLPSIDELRQKRSILFLGFPLGQDSSASPFITLFLSHFFGELLKTPIKNNHVPLACILEEFGNLQAIPGYTSIISMIRDKKVMLLHCIQTLSQLSSLYGEENATTILSNCNSIVALPSISDRKTLSFITEDLIGSTTLNEKQLVSIEKDHKEFGRRLMTKDELRRMKRNTGLLVRGNKQPIRLSFKPLYKSFFKKLRYGLSSKYHRLISKYESVRHNTNIQEAELIVFDSDDAIADQQQSFDLLMKKHFPNQ